jgi:hypothetical protein
MFNPNSAVPFEDRSWDNRDELDSESQLIGPWFFQSNDSPASNDDEKNFVAGFQAQRFSSLTRDYNLVLC